MVGVDTPASEGSGGHSLTAKGVEYERNAYDAVAPPACKVDVNEAIPLKRTKH